MLIFLFANRQASHHRHQAHAQRAAESCRTAAARHLSDVVCGAGLLLAALKGLLVMVSVNLPLVADEGYVHAVEEEYSKLMPGVPSGKR